MVVIKNWRTMSGPDFFILAGPGGSLAGNARELALTFEAEEEGEISSLGAAMLNSMRIKAVPDYVCDAAMEQGSPDGRSSLYPVMHARRAGMDPAGLVKEVTIEPTNPNCYERPAFRIRYADERATEIEGNVISCPRERTGTKNCNARMPSSATLKLKTGEELRMRPQIALPVAAIYRAPIILNGQPIESMDVGEMHQCTSGYAAVLGKIEECVPVVTGLGSDIGYYGLLTPMHRGPVRKILLESYGKEIPHNDAGFYTTVPIGKDDGSGLVPCQSLPHSYESLLQIMNEMAVDGKMPPVDGITLGFRQIEGSQNYMNIGIVTVDGRTYVVRDADIFPIARAFEVPVKAVGF